MAMRSILTCFSLFVLLCKGFSQSAQPAQPAQSARQTQSSQYLQPGFSGSEYLEMLKINAYMSDSMPIQAHIPAPAAYARIYRSPVVGLLNKWDMWVRNDHKVAVISIRGTTGDLPSWLENFYAAMVPANGSLQLTDSTLFTYQLAADSKAMVHVGWLVGLGYLAPTMLTRIRMAYGEGIREFIIVGHSQGGALAFLTRSYLYYLSRKGDLPEDIVIKTYCSAAPKPGNMYYAYDFDFITRNGWAFTVVNAADWVPETPFSLQAISDYNPVNPFVNIKPALRKQPWLVRLYIKGKYNKLNRVTRKAQKCFKSTLGDMVYKQVKKTLTQLRAPQYADGNNFQRAGIPIVLQPDSAYYARYPNDPTKVFQHHFFMPYMILTEKYYGK